MIHFSQLEELMSCAYLCANKGRQRKYAAVGRRAFTVQTSPECCKPWEQPHSGSFLMLNPGSFTENSFLLSTFWVTGVSRFYCSPKLFFSPDSDLPLLKLSLSQLLPERLYTHKNFLNMELRVLTEIWKSFCRAIVLDFKLILK